jgi:predicted extracellular nuclease
VRVRGIVFADFDQSSRKGFFIQEEGCDLDPTTSDGIYIYLGTLENVVQAGDQIEAVGIVQEFAGMTEIRSTPDQVVVLSQDLPLPPMVQVDPPFDGSSAVEYYESLEGMYSTVSEALVVGPTNSSAQAWVVRADLRLERVFQDDPRGTGVVIEITSSMDAAWMPDVKCGDRMSQLKGFIGENQGSYALDLLDPPLVSPSPPSEPVENNLPNGFFSAGSLNLSNLFDSIDDLATDDDVLSAQEYQRKLKKLASAIHETLNEPDILALQEGENLPVFTALSLRPEIAADYGIAWEESPDLRGQDIAIFYRIDRMNLLDTRSYQGCTGLVDGLGPDGNQDVTNPVNAITCDRDGDGVLDGNRLFSRPPLVARFNLQILPPGYPGPLEIIVIANHWKSKVEDTNLVAYTQARRQEEAVFASQLGALLAVQHPDAVILALGDLNDYPTSAPLTAVKSAGWVDITSQVTRTHRYTYIHQGVSQVLDYALIVQCRQIGARSLPVHINADFPSVFEQVADSIYRSSDHDPQRVDFYWLPENIYIPLAFNAE